MKKISLKGISEILSEKELKNVVGGGSGLSISCLKNCETGTPCFFDGYQGTCFYDFSFSMCACYV